MIAVDGFGQHLGGGPPRPIDLREQHAVAVLELLAGQPGFAQEAFQRLRAARCRAAP